MSRYEIFLIRAALVYLLLTGSLGVLFYLFPVLVPYFRVTHIHLGMIGFFLSFVMGVAYWLMPRPGGLRQEGLAAVTFYLLNTGLILRLIAEPLWRSNAVAGFYPLVVASGFLQLAAFAVFAVAMWARVQTAETIRRAREARAKING